MREKSRYRPIALVVEDDATLRELATLLLEESEMAVVTCESAENALEILDKLGPSLSLLYTDVNLAGKLDGVELAHYAHSHHPKIHVVVASGYSLKTPLPGNATLMPKPWVALDLLREAARSQTGGD